MLFCTALILLQACGSTTKDASENEADLPVRKPCNLERLYKDMPQDIRTDTPDLAFVNALCAGKADEVASLFREKKLFWNEKPAVDAPYGRFEGLEPSSMPHRPRLPLSSRPSVAGGLPWKVFLSSWWMQLSRKCLSLSLLIFGRLLCWKKSGCTRTIHSFRA